MSASATLRRSAPLPAAVQAGLIAALVAIAAASWALTDDRMGGMDAGPGSDLGALGWFLVTWVVMMAAMMLPSVAPMVVAQARIRRERDEPAAVAATPLFVAGYVLAWTVVVDAPDLIPARVGDSDHCEIGDVVMAFGNPFNLRQSVTRGIISGMGRSNLDLGDGGVDYQNFMQTDAAINPGNSGGPLINLRGEVVGLNTAIASNSGGNDGIGFSIPINIVMSVTRQLVEHGRVDRGFLGVMLDGNFNLEAARSAGLPRLMGALVKQVTERSPAALAGVQTNDVILRYNNAAIENDQHLINLVKLSDVGRPVEMVVLRGGQMVNIKAQIGRLDDFVAETEAALKSAP